MKYLFAGGVDPGGVVAGYALVVCGRYSGGCEVLDCGIVKSMSGAAMSVVYDRWHGVVADRTGSFHSSISIGVEGQWIPQIDAKTKPNRLKQIMGQINATVEVAANRGAWLALAEARGWDTTKVHPSQWRSVIGRGVRDREPLKKAAISNVVLREDQLFRSIPPPRRMPDHLAESILIAEYIAKREQQANAQGELI
jgi:Holliday junction resolvasome RuvABC endonuclease subunit